MDPETNCRLQLWKSKHQEYIFVECIPGEAMFMINQCVTVGLTLSFSQGFWMVLQSTIPLKSALTNVFNHSW